MPSRHLFSCTLLAAALSVALPATGHNHPPQEPQPLRQLGPHVHGLVYLNAALDGDQLVIELQSPGADIAGFEGKARDAADRQRLADAQAKLKQVDQLFAFVPAGACIAQGAVEIVVPAAAGDGSAHDHDHDHEHDAAHDHDHGAAHNHDPAQDHDRDHDAEQATEHQHSHSDWQLRWRFACGDAAALRSIRVLWFEQFPSTQRIQAQWIGPAGQNGFELTPAAATIDTGR